TAAFRTSSQPPSANVCTSCAATSAVAADNKNGASSDCAAPRKPTADNAKPTPEAIPRNAERVVQPRAIELSGRSRSAGENKSTPAVAVRIATAVGHVSGSPRKATPKTATRIISVFE